MPANTLQFDSKNSAYSAFRIEQEHDTTPPPPHDHTTMPDGSEKPAESDGWVSTVVLIATGEQRGPYKFTGEAMAEMRLWAAELKGLKPVQDSVAEEENT